jgi:5-methylcytosine-specific restriction endonuclease McrA
MHGRHAKHGDHHRPHHKGSASHPHRSDLHADAHAELDGEDSIPGDLNAALAGLTVSAGNEGLNAKVLVLNKAYAAMRVVSARRAFILLAREIAEIIHVDTAQQADGNGGFLNYDLESWIEISALQREFEPDRHDWVRTVRMEIAVPRIIRLLGYDRLPEQTVKLNRRNLFARDRNRCQYCGRIFPTNDLSIDHVLPRAQGGGDSWENLVCACIKCNARKGGRTPDQAHMKLVKKPERPKRNPIIALKLGHEKYASWKAFLDHAYWDVELR